MHLFSFVLGISLLMSFGPLPSDKVSGKYGVAAGDPSRIELVLNEDYTFSYRDFSDPQKKVDVTGRWEWRKSSIVLHANAAGQRFHDRWKPEADGTAIRSAKGMTFYRLVRLDK